MKHTVSMMLHKPEVSTEPEEFDESGEAQLVHLLHDQWPRVLQDQGVSQGREETSGQPLWVVWWVTPFHQGGDLKFWQKCRVKLDYNNHGCNNFFFFLSWVLLHRIGMITRFSMVLWVRYNWGLLYFTFSWTVIWCNVYNHRPWKQNFLPS